MGSGWAHAPRHVFVPGGIYIITAATLHRQPLFDTAGKLDLMQDIIFRSSSERGIDLQAWAFLRNHYHVLASFEGAGESATLHEWISRAHTEIGLRLNALDRTPGRRVMYQYWDTGLTYERSWLARLHYVHENPVKHGLVAAGRDYPWCSAHWFETNARPAFVKTVRSFRIDRIRVPDDF